MKKLLLIVYLFCPLSSVKAQHHHAKAAALLMMSESDPAEALIMAKSMENEKALEDVVFTIYTQSGGRNEWAFVYKTFKSKPSIEQYNLSGKLGEMIAHIKDSACAIQGVKALRTLGTTCYKDEKIRIVLSLIVHVRKDEIAMLAKTAMEEML